MSTPNHTSVSPSSTGHAAAPLTCALSGVVAAAILSLALPPHGQAASFPELDRLASLFAMRQVTVRCPDPTAWSADEIASHGWAYVPAGAPMTPIPDHMVAAPFVCAGALAIARGRRTVHPWQMAAGVLVLVHEAYHLRIWRYRLD